VSSTTVDLTGRSEPERVELAGRGLMLVADRWAPAGPSRGVLVLLPGGGQTRHSWDRSAQQLASSGWTTWTVDARGHGESGWAPRPAADYGIVAQAADLEAALRELRRRDGGWTALIGASMGGMTAMQYVATHPRGTAQGGDAVDALVLVDITPSTEPAGVARIRAFMDTGKDGFGSLDELIDAVSAYRPGIPRRSAASLRHNVRQGEDGRFYWHWDPQFHRLDNGLADRDANRRALLAAARHVDVPTLVLRGDASDVVSADGAAELLDVLPRGEEQTIRGAGHMVVGDDNSMFVRAVEEFLGRHALREE
jgi:pimeloyl-ACP methyl ester carboxylesterase